MKFNSFCYLFLSIVALSCTKDKISKEISVYLKSNSLPKIEKYHTLVLVSDNQCYKCFESFQKLNDHKNTLALFYSKYPEQFKEVLVKVNSRLDWKSLKNSNLINKVSNELHLNGPFIFKISNSKDLKLIYPL